MDLALRGVCGLGRRAPKVSLKEGARGVDRMATVFYFYFYASSYFSFYFYLYF